MIIQSLQVVQLIQQDSGIEFAIVPGLQSLHCMVDGFFVPLMEQVSDFFGPIHGFDLDLECFGFIG